MAQVEHGEREALRARLVKELMDLGMEEEDAHFAVSLHLGETMGDVVADPPLTQEEYRALGLDRDFLFRPRPDLAKPAAGAGSKRRPS